MAPWSLANVAFAATEIRDSRARPTVRAEATLGDLTASGDVPAGASKGRDEARTVPTEQARRHVERELLAVVRGVEGDVRSVETLFAADAAMAQAAGDNFATLGANATLPVSRALWRLAAAARGVPLWQLWREAMGPALGAARPLCLFNVFNGGLHAVRPGEQLGRERIDVQEIMVVPLGMDARAALAAADAIDAALAGVLARAYGAERVGRGDEAGLSVSGLGRTEQAIAHVVAAIEAAGYEPGRQVQLALDVAAGSLVQDGGYRREGRACGGAELSAWLLGLVRQAPGLFCSVEDGLGEDDWAGWRGLTADLRAEGVLSVGDDLFVTQPARLARGIAEQAASAILIKVNQNGTVGGTLRVMQQARAAQLATIVSHRSGETLDDSIADLAVACGAFGLKTGAPQPPAAYPDPATWVRRQKYLRLCAIEQAG